MKALLAAALLSLAAAPIAAQTTAAPVDSAMAPGTLIESRSRVEGGFRSYYPQLLLDAGVGGAVIASFRVEPDGTVSRDGYEVASEDHEMFGDATRRLVARLRFQPYPKPVRVTIRAEWRPVGTQQHPTATGSLRILRVVELAP